jgi:hypothetical protein
VIPGTQDTVVKILATIGIVILYIVSALLLFLLIFILFRKQHIEKKIGEWNVLLDSMSDRIGDIMPKVQDRLQKRQISELLVDVSEIDEIGLYGKKETRIQLKAQLKRAVVYFGVHSCGTDLYLTLSSYIDMSNITILRILNSVNYFLEKYPILFIPFIISVIGIPFIVLSYIISRGNISRYEYDNLYSLEQSIHHSILEVVDIMLTENGIDRNSINREILHSK